MKKILALVIFASLLLPTLSYAGVEGRYVFDREKMLNDLLFESGQGDSDQELELQDAKSEFHTNRVDAYTQQNVFERLQKTTTRAYAVKQTTTPQEKQGDEQTNASSSNVGNLETAERGNVDADRMLDEILDGSSTNMESATSDFPAEPVSRRLRSRS